MGEFFRHAWDVALRLAGAVAGMMAGEGIGLLCGLMALDYVMGVALGIVGKSRLTENGRLSARAGFRGLLRKGGMLTVILLSAILDQVAGQENLLRRAATGFYICNEGISLLENAAALGVPVPRGIKKALGALGEGKAS